jgi:hypothetical protein
MLEWDGIEGYSLLFPPWWPICRPGDDESGKSKPWARKKKECTFIPEKIVFYWNLWCRFTPKLA